MNGARARLAVRAHILGPKLSEIRFCRHGQRITQGADLKSESAWEEQNPFLSSLPAAENEEIAKIAAIAEKKADSSTPQAVLCKSEGPPAALGMTCASVMGYG